MKLERIRDFLGCDTPKLWFETAATQQELLLIDHAHCEKKAAATALNLIFRYVEHPKLLHTLSRLAREELRHFERVLKLIAEEGYRFRHLSPSRYAEALRKQVRSGEPERLVDILIVGAFIEARSCERFAGLLPYLAPNIASFYELLLASESRHFLNYLDFAHHFAQEALEPRIDMIRRVENQLILSEDSQFRFHSGVPTLTLSVGEATLYPDPEFAGCST